MQSIAVFTGSRSGSNAAYAATARAFGQAIGERGLRLVYGGGRVGLMGVLADTVLAAGGEVIGVIPEFLYEKEVGHTGLTELEVVPGMHERKARFEQLSDAFVALPGGFGTLDELFEALTWGQLQLHKKPVGLLNADGFYDTLLQFMDANLAAGFIRPEHRDALLVGADADTLLSKLASFKPVDVVKWR